MKNESPRNADKAGDFLSLRAANGLEVYVLPTRKFKTKLVRVHLRAELSGRNASRALALSLLRRGTRKLPTMVDVSRALEGLFGTLWSSSTYKLGDEQILSLRLETVEERFLPGNPKVFAPALDVAHDLLFDPYLVQGRFPADVFEQEKLNHRREIEAQYNEKLTWAFQRLLDVMFADEPYGRPVLGTRQEADALKPEDPVAAWREMTATLPARVFAVGDFTPDDVLRFVEQKLALKPPAQGAARDAARTRALPAEAPRVVVEKESISQSKLVSGRFVDLANLAEREFDALRVFAGVLGGGFHSRLFQTVREKHSLAYFASSSLDRLRGVLYTSCGIDAADREKVCDLVEKEIASLQQAPPRDEELEQTKKLIVASTRGTVDSPGGMIETFESGLAAGRVRSIDAIGRSVAAVTAADVQAAAKRLRGAPIVYCLEGEARHEAPAPAGEGKESRTS
jgi:predicted Zn-dependent peptidase